jgi:hypothetical protein
LGQIAVEEVFLDCQVLETVNFAILADQGGVLLARAPFKGVGGLLLGNVGVVKGN